MKESQAISKLCPMGINNGFCQGSLCMAWEPYHKVEEKTIPLNEPVPDGWDIAGHNGIVCNIRRWAVTDSGDCGMKSKEHGCSYSG